MSSLMVSQASSFAFVSSMFRRSRGGVGRAAVAGHPQDPSEQRGRRQAVALQKVETVRRETSAPTVEEYDAERWDGLA